MELVGYKRAMVTLFIYIELYSESATIERSN